MDERVRDWGERLKERAEKDDLRSGLGKGGSGSETERRRVLWDDMAANAGCIEM